jgi:hypothetical protein
MYCRHCDLCSTYWQQMLAVLLQRTQSSGCLQTTPSNRQMCSESGLRCMPRIQTHSLGTSSEPTSEPCRWAVLCVCSGSTGQQPTGDYQRQRHAWHCNITPCLCALLQYAVACGRNGWHCTRLHLKSYPAGNTGSLNDRLLLSRASSSTAIWDTVAGALWWST